MLTITIAFLLPARCAFLSRKSQGIMYTGIVGSDATGQTWPKRSPASGGTEIQWSNRIFQSGFVTELMLDVSPIYVQMLPIPHEIIPEHSLGFCGRKKISHHDQYS